MKKVLYIRNDKMENEDVVRKLERAGYVVIEYRWKDDSSEFSEILNSEFFYYVFSFSFIEMVYNVCMKTASKYAIWLKEESAQGIDSERMGRNINYFIVSDNAMYQEMQLVKNINCCYVQWDDNSFINAEKFIFTEKELELYQTIDELFILHKNYDGPRVVLTELDKVNDDEELIRLTECYFAMLEGEKELSLRLEGQLLAYIDNLLKGKTWDSWREIVLWNKRHECKDLMKRSWKFFLLQKIGALYAEETINYYERGEVPSVLQMGSFEELSDTYFQLLLLLRRLNYNIASEEDGNIVEFIMNKRLSRIYVKHVIEHNQIENKEMVYSRLEELMAKYER